MQTQGKRHGCLGWATVLHHSPNRQGLGLEPNFKAQSEPKRIGRSCLRAVAELEANPITAVQRRQLPGQITGKAVLRHREGSLGQHQLIAGHVPAHGEEHWNPAAHALAGIRKALSVEIQALLAARTPTGDQATPLRHHLQLIPVRGPEQPVGVRGLNAGEGHRSVASHSNMARFT